jgi:hypothetical protein
MKKIMIKGISTLALLLALANCGGSNNGNNPTTFNPYGDCAGLPVAQQQACFNNQFGTVFGHNNNFYQGTGTCYGYTCQVYQVPYMAPGCNNFCGTQWYGVTPFGGYYFPQTNSNFSFSVGGSFNI